jgi:hypothetical protein
LVTLVPWFVDAVNSTILGAVEAAAVTVTVTAAVVALAPAASKALAVSV